MINIYKTIYDFLENKEIIVLAFVIDHSGSTPRATGAKMIVRNNKEIIGTVGGGKIEAEVQKLAATTFENKRSSINKFSLTMNEVASLGMSCGGEATVYLQYMDASDERNLDTYREIYKVYEKNQRAWLVTSVLKDEKEYLQHVYIENGEVQNNLSSEIFNDIKKYFDNKSHFINEQDKKYLIEPLAMKSKAFIFGGGHIGYELVPVLNRVGFHTTLIDDREEFANKNRFPLADEIVMEAFKDAFSRLFIDRNSFIIIVTRGHIHDQLVLSKALRTDALYIGMIGSSKKKGLVYQNLLEEGFSLKQLEKVHSPIGLEINAETPEEIAISIVAEIIKVRSENNG